MSSRKQNQNPRYWENWEHLISDSDPGRESDIQLLRDPTGGFHLLTQHSENIVRDIELTPQAAAKFCLKTFVPEALHNHFAIV